MQACHEASSQENGGRVDPGAAATATPTARSTTSTATSTSLPPPGRHRAAFEATQSLRRHTLFEYMVSWSSRIFRWPWIPGDLANVWHMFDAQSRCTLKIFDSHDLALSKILLDQNFMSGFFCFHLLSTYLISILTTGCIQGPA